MCLNKFCVENEPFLGWFHKWNEIKLEWKELSKSNNIKPNQSKKIFDWFTLQITNIANSITLDWIKISNF